MYVQHDISCGCITDVQHTDSEVTNTDTIIKAEEASVEFGVLLSKILEVLTKNKKKNLELLKSICSTLTVKNDSKISTFSKEQLKEIMACTDIRSLFLIELRNYWRWDDFSVLSVVVSSLNSKKCETLLDQYKGKIDAKIKLSEIYQQCEKEKDFPKGLHKMVAIISKLFYDITKKEYSELKRFISQHCGVEAHAISPFVKALSSSLILEWYIPGAAAAYMIEMATGNKNLFIIHGFVYLKITTSVILDERCGSAVSISKFNKLLSKISALGLTFVVCVWVAVIYTG